MYNTKIILTDNYGSNNKHYLDIADINIPITYAIGDIRSIGQRNTPYSKTIKLPGTKNNNQIFTNIFEINNSINFNPAKKAYCVVLSDEIPVLYGYFQLTAIDISDSAEVEYEAVLFGILGDIASILGDNVMVGNVDASGVLAPSLDLTFPELAHNSFNYINVENTWTENSDTYGYIYPLINYGSGWNNNKAGNGGFADFPIVPLQDLFPSIFVKRIWDKIFANCNYQYNSTFLNSELFKRLFLVGNPKSPASPITAYLSNDVATPASGFIPFDDTTSLGTDINLQWQVRNSSYFSASGLSFKPTISGDYYFTLNATVAINFTRDLTVYLSDAVSGPILANPFVASYGVTGSRGINVTNTFTLVAGHSYMVYAENGLLGLPVTFNAGSYISFRLADSTTPDLNYALPSNFKQIDFITTIVKMFNLVIEQDRDNPQMLYIEPRDTYYANGTLVDWSQKIDRSSDYQLKLISELAGLTYNFNYAADRDYINSNYTTVTNENYGQEVKIIDNDFVTNTVNINPSTAPTGFYKVQGFDQFIVPALFQNTNDTFSQFDFKPRILYSSGIYLPIQGISGGGNGKIYIDYTGNIGTAPRQYTSYYFTGSYELPITLAGITSENAVSLNYGNIIPQNNFDAGNLTNTLFNKYWSNYLSQISSPNSKVLLAKFHLTALDIENIRFNDTIYLEVENSPSYWYINQIIDYNPVLPDVTQVELIYFDPNPPFPFGSVFKSPPPNKNLILTRHNDTNTVSGNKNIVDHTTQNATGNGNMNMVASNGNNITLFGNNNRIGAETENVIVQGNGNIIPTGTTNVMVIGNDITVTESNKNYFSNGIEINGYAVVTENNITGTTEWVSGMANIISPNAQYFSFNGMAKGMLLPSMNTSQRMTIPLDGTTNGFVCLDTDLNVSAVVINGAWQQFSTTALG